jgi:hypothetical protein
MSEVGKTYAQLQTGAGATIYPAFVCGAPPNEPTCTPKRPTSVNGSTIYTGARTAADGDGDGIVDATDKCPTVFDPIRPVDNGVQPDADGDGAGDACDPCPLDANTTTCTRIELTDRDHDGTPNATDNCPFLPNAGQADADTDGRGDACDACPADANPTFGCPTTIYKIKTGTTPLGLDVRLANALVTGKGSNGFFVQTKLGDGGYNGPEYSGLFVFTGSGTPPLANATVGARVTIDGTVTSFQGQIEIDTVTAVTVTSPGPEALPDPVPVTYAQIKTGGPRAAELESVLVEVGPAIVSATSASAGEFTLSDGTDSLVVDDFLFAPGSAPQVGWSFRGTRGILALRQMASKLEPRGVTDLVPGIATLTPALSYVRAGETTGMPTFPSPLIVTLSGPAQGDTTVTLTSGDPAALTVTDVTIPNGQTTGTVSATALASSASVDVTAALAGVMKTAAVRVLGAADLPATVTLSPAGATIPPGGSVQLTVTLDLPAPAAGTPVAITVTPPGAGTVPATVTVAANKQTATFTYTDVMGGMSTVTATLGGSTSSTTINVSGAPNRIVISQLYGGGGNSMATFTHDFIELHNPTATPLMLAAGSLQYAAAAGTSWTVSALPANLTIPAGGYLLVQLAGGANGAPLPTPDVAVTTAPIINMSGTAGKVALVSTTTALTGNGCPISASVVDFVGYGATANCSEGGMPAPGLSNTTAGQRKQAGCVDNNSNSADFATGTPAPRNSATAPAVCP